MKKRTLNGIAASIMHILINHWLDDASESDTTNERIGLSLYDDLDNESQRYVRKRMKIMRDKIT